ncbi:hypothetical protein [Enterococcus thailandicus]|uniref:hypothetical protein n=1 Tax=Enterococcus thailandicus TaxID=417368 RepID=UPI00244D8A11|nr:hypothetical protein [Enterococcus thailandicus]GMC02369.1 hypothetical protein K2F_26300 [Enterococcus thailandicus]
MNNIKIGQIWENKHLFNDAYDVVVCWVTDGFVWMRYTNDDALFKESQSFFLRLRRLKSDSYFLNDNQKIVLEWLKGYLVDDCDFRNTLKQMYFLQINGIAYKKENLAFMKLTERELAQVVQVFSNWFLEQEEENNDH